MADFLLSVVIPVYNEDKTIDALLQRLLPIIKKYNYELILVNDGSRDMTATEIKKIAAKNKRIKLVSFIRNFSHMMALTAGYHYAKGDCVITMDADGQDPPEIIPDMVDKWQSGAKIVYAKRKKREVDSFAKRITAQMYYKFLNFLSDVPIPEDVGDYRLLDKEVVQFLNNLPEHARFFRGLVAWSGYTSDYVYFNREKRYAGTTHYTVSKMINLALLGITSFSTKPLRLAIYLGFITSASSVFVILHKIIMHFVFHSEDWLPGWPSLFFAIVFLGGVQLITIGIIGEYISKIYLEVQQRPRYIIRETVNI